MEQRIHFKFEEIIRWWGIANTTGVWGALSRGFGGQEFLGFHLKTSKDMAVNLDQRKAHFSTHVSASESIFTFSKTHLPPSPSFPDVFPGTPPRSSPLDSLSRVCLLSSPGQTVPGSSTISPMKSEGAAAQIALLWLGCAYFTFSYPCPVSELNESVTVTSLKTLWD